MPRLKHLLVDRGAQLSRCGGEATPARPLLAAANGPHDTHTTISSINTQLDRCAEVFITQLILDRKRLESEGAARRFREQR